MDLAVGRRAGSGKLDCAMKVLLVSPLLLVLAGCTTNSSIPDARDMDKYHRAAEAVMKPERDALEQKRASGQISETEYQAQLAMLERQVSERATDAAWTRHALAESERKMSGIPTPDAPVDLQAPTAGGSGALPTGGTYRRFNDQDMGYSTSAQVPREFFSGYRAGSTMRGSQGRSN